MNIFHRKGWSRSLVIGLVGCSAVFALSCSKTKDSPGEAKKIIIGAWQVRDEKSTIEFRTDGTIRGTDNGEAETGTYTFSDATHLQIVVDLPNGNRSATETPATLVLDCSLTVQDNDNIDVSVVMSTPGDKTNTKKESAHFKRIKQP